MNKSSTSEMTTERYEQFEQFEATTERYEQFDQYEMKIDRHEQFEATTDRYEQFDHPGLFWGNDFNKLEEAGIWKR